MFCKNCGNQMDDNAQFCPACGASTGSVAPQNTVVAGAISKKFNEIKANFNKSCASLGQSKLFVLSGILALVLNFIFSVVGVFKFEGAKVYFPMFFNFDGETNEIYGSLVFGAVLFTAVFAVAISLYVYPLLANKAYSSKAMLVAAAFAALTLIWFIIGAIVFADKAGKYLDTELTVCGWFFIFAAAANLLLSVYNYLGFKKKGL